MATSNESRSSMDTAKLALALIILFLGIAAYYWFVAHPDLYRVLYVVGAGIVAVGVFMTSGTGANLRAFMKGARTELRKVVWPNRQETLQTTMAVIVVVFLVAIFLFFVDRLLGWGVRGLITGG